MNAIILAAGMGTRLRPLTNDIPKCLVPVRGEPIIERQIRFLNDSDVKDITLISGYCSNKLEYLQEKYNVNILYNPKYDICNNIYSLLIALEQLKDTYVIEGDVYMAKNCFIKDIKKSSYFASWKDSYKREWGLITEQNQKLKNIIPGDGSGYIMSGVSFWNHEDSLIIAKKLKAIVKSEDCSELFWDHVILRYHHLMDINIIPTNELYEIDTVDELQELERILRTQDGY